MPLSPPGPKVGRRGKGKGKGTDKVEDAAAKNGEVEKSKVKAKAKATHRQGSQSTCSLEKRGFPQHFVLCSCRGIYATFAPVVQDGGDTCEAHF